MKRILLAFALVAAAPPVLETHAQTKTDRATVQWGPEMSDSKNGLFDDVFGYNDDAVYMTVAVKKETFIRKMDNRHKVVYQKLLPMKIDKNDHDMERVVLAGDKILVFTTFLDKKSKQNSLYCRVFNESDMSPSGRLQKLASMDVEKRRYAGSFDVSISPNEKLVLVNRNLPYEKEGRERFSLKVFDDEMRMQWERNIDLPYLDSEFSVERTRVDDDGSVMIIGNKYAEKREAKELKKDGKATYTYHLLIYRDNGTDPEDHAIDIAGKFLQDLSITVGTDGDILCGGFYGAKGSFTTGGAFFLRLDRATKQVVHSSFKEFDREFITMYMTEKEEAKATKKADKKGEELEMYNYKLREIIRRTDGGAVLLGEQYLFYTSTVCTPTQNGGQTCSTVYHYVYNDIIAVNIDPDGNIEWAAKVPKRQHSTNDGGRYSSYASVVKGDNIHLLFNDSGKNLFLKPGDKVAPFRYGKDMVITLATIDGDGTVYREALLAVDKREAITRPKAAVQIGDDRLFIYANWKKTHQFGTVSFK